jgi:class 3 adenylate cyclase
MPIFLDRHDLSGLTAGDIAEAHRKDLEVQDRYGVRFLTYWFDAQRGTGFCLIDAPDAATAMRVHEEAHGDLATEVIEVDLSAVEAFLGRVTDLPSSGPSACPAPDTAFRAVMFTDLVDSTGMTARLGDIRAVEMVRAHDSMVRRALAAHGGREVKHTGDGMMASFTQVAAAVAATCAIQRAFEAFNRDTEEKMQVRIGIHAGEPVEDSNDLFGTTVQMAARICQHAAAGSIVITDAVGRELAGDVDLKDVGPQTLKGFAEPIVLHEVVWWDSTSTGGDVVRSRSAEHSC